MIYFKRGIKATVYNLMVRDFDNMYKVRYSNLTAIDIPIKEKNKYKHSN